MKTALIFAADRSTRWAAVGYPKQLFEIRGVPIIERTVAQLLDRDIRPVIITNTSELDVDEADLELRDRCRWLVEEIWNSYSLWHGEMLGLFGDVCWTNEAMDTLCAAEGLKFLGREHDSLITGGCPECFGWTWGPDDYGELLAGLGTGFADALTKDPTGEHYNHMTGAIWQPYRAICGIPIDAHCQVDKEHWVRVNDHTDDVDTPGLAAGLARVWERDNVQ